MGVGTCMMDCFGIIGGFSIETKVLCSICSMTMKTRRFLARDCTLKNDFPV